MDNRTLSPEVAERNRILTGHQYTFRWCAKWVERHTAGLGRDDAAALVALHVLEKWDQYDPARSRLTTWIRCIARTIITLHGSYVLAGCRDARKERRPGENYQYADRRPCPADELADAEEYSRDLGRATAAVDALPDRLRCVLRWRLGLGGEALTLQEVADRLGLTRERVRQLEAEAVRLAREAAGVESSTPYSRPRPSAAVKPTRAMPRGYFLLPSGRVRFTRRRAAEGVKVNKVFPTLEAARRWVAANLDGTPADTESAGPTPAKGVRP